MITLSVPDMHCGGCKASIEKALANHPGVERLEFDLERRRLGVVGPVEHPSLIAALDRIGFPAAVVLP